LRGKGVFVVQVNRIKIVSTCVDSIHWLLGLMMHQRRLMMINHISIVRLLLLLVGIVVVMIHGHHTISFADIVVVVVTIHLLVMIVLNARQAWSKAILGQRP